MDCWTLDGHEPRVATRDEWVALMESPERRRVTRTTVGDADVSTVFLGIDHAFGDGPPLLFETMVFGGDHAGSEWWRCTTWAEAEAQHARVVAALTAGEEP